CMHNLNRAGCGVKQISPPRHEDTKGTKFAINLAHLVSLAVVCRIEPPSMPRTPREPSDTKRSSLLCFFVFSPIPYTLWPLCSLCLCESFLRGDNSWQGG